MKDWRDNARENPDIQKWYTSVRVKNPNAPRDVVDYMIGNKYDFKGAIKSGFTPKYNPEKDEMSWPGMNKMESQRKFARTIDKSIPSYGVVACSQNLRNHKTKAIKGVCS